MKFRIYELFAFIHFFKFPKRLMKLSNALNANMQARAHVRSPHSYARARTRKNVKEFSDSLASNSEQIRMIIVKSWAQKKTAAEHDNSLISRDEDDVGDISGDEEIEDHETLYDKACAWIPRDDEEFDLIDEEECHLIWFHSFKRSGGFSCIVNFEKPTIRLYRYVLITIRFHICLFLSFDCPRGSDHHRK